MILSEAFRLRGALDTLTVEMQRTRDMAIAIEAMWAAFGEPTPVTLFTDAERAEFVALQAKAELLRDTLDARTVAP